MPRRGEGIGGTLEVLYNMCKFSTSGGSSFSFGSATGAGAVKKVLRARGFAGTLLALGNVPYEEEAWEGHTKSGFCRSAPTPRARW